MTHDARKALPVNWQILAMAVAAGALVAVQVALNGRMRGATGSPGLSALISLGTGFIALLPLVGAGTLGPRWPNALGDAPWWAWLGGLCGAAYLVATVLGLPRIGAALLFGSMMLGQLAMGLLTDSFGGFGTAKYRNYPFTPHRARLRHLGRRADGPKLGMKAQERKGFMKPRVLAIAGSARSGSVNQKLLMLACASLSAQEIEIADVDLRGLDLPIYDGDLDEHEGQPSEHA